MCVCGGGGEKSLHPTAAAPLECVYIDILYSFKRLFQVITNLRRSSPFNNSVRHQRSSVAHLNLKKYDKDDASIDLKREVDAWESYCSAVCKELKEMVFIVYIKQIPQTPEGGGPIPIGQC